METSDLRADAEGEPVGAYYNELDPFAAAWLRELIKAGHIAPGEVDERSIEQVRPEDLKGFRQCHFFSGIGVWSHALRRLRSEMTHSELCAQARRWLAGSRRCAPVFSGIASCDEVPDAIGWSSTYRWHGSTVIECKTSVADFHADKKKRRVWVHPEHGWEYPGQRISLKEAKEAGYIEKERLRMGDFRFYLCDAGILVPELVQEHAPGHGLLYAEGGRTRVALEAPRREQVSYGAEIRYLRFAIINAKEPDPPCTSRYAMMVAEGRLGGQASRG